MADAKKNQDNPNLKNALLRYTSKPGTPPEGKPRALLDIFRKRIVHQDVVMVHQGDHWKKVYFLERGIVRMFINTPDGREFNKNFFTEGEFFWPATPATRLRPSLFSIATLETCHIQIADFSRFQKQLMAMQRWESAALLLAEALADLKISREYELLSLLAVSYG